MERVTRVDAAVIGGGPGGISAAIWCGRLGLSTVLVEKEPEIGGQLHEIQNGIIDYPGLILRDGAELIRLFRHHLDHLKIPVATRCRAVSLNLDTRTIRTSQGIIQCRYVVLATGARQRRLRIPGEAEMIGRGEIYSTSRDRHKLAGKDVLIVGGGDRALEGAINLADAARSVTLVHWSERFRARPQFVRLVENHPKIAVFKSTVLKEIHGSERVEAVTLENLKDGKILRLPVEAVLIRIGVEPVTDFIPEAIKRNEAGYILTDADGRTNVPWIYAVGDLVNPPDLCSIVLSAGQGMRAAKSIVKEMIHG